MRQKSGSTAQAVRKVVKVTGVLLALGIVAVGTPSAYADPAKSNNYSFDEGTIGTSGYLDASSANYQSTTATGDLSVGNSKSTNYQVEAGTKTTNDPTLSFAITSGNINFGSFSATAAATTTATFSVSNYSSYGYTVQLLGTPPTYSGRTINALASTDSSRPGVEQFGINLVANTSPSSIGANPDNGQFGFGSANSNYSTSNQYRFVSGETIAQSPKSSGDTNYTITYIVNVTGLTRGGQYISNQTLLVTGSY